MSKQTSVEWLQQEYEFNKILTNQDFGIGKEMLTYKEFEQAKEMHKQEIINTWYNGYINQSPMIDEENCGEQFYKETFLSKGSDETFKVWECCGMEECICKGSYVEKLAEEEYPIFDGDLLGISYNQKQSRIDFIKGYNKAKETLYTKQDIIDSVNRMYDIFMDDTLEAKKLRLKGISWHIQNTLESLKQPKKD